MYVALLLLGGLAMRVGYVWGRNDQALSDRDYLAEVILKAEKIKKKEKK